MIVEIKVGGNFYYVKADIPLEIVDLQDMIKEENLPGLSSVDHVTPHKNEILRPITITQDDVAVERTNTQFVKNAYKITPEFYETLPLFDWLQIMNFCHLQGNRWLTWVLELGHILLMTAMISWVYSCEFFF